MQYIIIFSSFYVVDINIFRTEIELRRILISFKNIPVAGIWVSRGYMYPRKRLTSPVSDAAGK